MYSCCAHKARDMDRTIALCRNFFFFAALLALKVLNGRLNRILCKHRAVQFDRRQTKLFGDVCVLDRSGVVQRFAFNPFSGKRGGGDSTAAPKCFKFNIFNDTCLVHADLKLHDIATSGGTHKTRSHRGIIFGKRANVPWLFIMVNNLENSKYLIRARKR
jgi:hypothetical protein